MRSDLLPTPDPTPTPPEYSAAAGDVVCILDALDECASDGQLTLISFLVEFYNSTTAEASRSSTLKFLGTSRPYDNIERPFHGIAAGLPTIRLAGEEENRPNSPICCPLSVHHLWPENLSRAMTEVSRIL
ncbi:hypothetical protein GJ744_004813 [Endocarpon pusillum]|uniref:Nephrocystin 3-like N-terminal domain-containing protein n=1 Tax=Endocarpon pusillum TaxID=364733 RepID=A0A8H7A882_9EURO|nr:hypothetical protein GJ744_004813 [Endocarpon pusillum]